MKMSRRAYAEMFGPTVGDRVRLADTELFIEVEQDFTTYGEEVKSVAGKSFVMAWDNRSFCHQKWLTLSLQMP